MAPQLPTSRPLEGYRICFTSVPFDKREAMVSQITTMGGTHMADLMTDVNVLVVGRRDTDKYKFSVKYRHDILFVTADAISSLYVHWMNNHKGSVLDINYYKLTVFSQLSICMSRISETSTDLQVSKYPHRRQWQQELYIAEKLAEAISENGGKVSDTLRHSIDVVIATETQGKRFVSAKQWGTPIVHPLWVIDSVARGACMDPKDYSMGMTTMNGCNVWDQLTSAPAVSITEKREDKPLKKRSDVWNSIMTRDTASKSKFINSAWDEEDANEDDSDDHEADNASDTEKPAKEAKSALFLGLKLKLVGFTPHQMKLLHAVIKSHGGESVEDLRGPEKEEDDDTITHIVIPFSAGPRSSQLLRQLSSFIKGSINNRTISVVTEWFIERSIYYHRIVEDTWCRPCKGLVPSLKPFEICISGFTGIELLHIPKIIQSLGFKYSESLSSSKDLLIININLFKPSLLKNSPQLFQYKFPDVINCPTYDANDNNRKSVALLSSTNKINAAKKWHIPIVSLAYLWQMMQLSTHKASLVMPDLLDLNWCIFAPSQYVKPATLLDYVRGLSGGSFSTQAMDAATSEATGAVAAGSTSSPDKVELPSPRKSSNSSIHTKYQYGRLAGVSPSRSSSVSDKLAQAASASEQPQHDDDENDNDDGNNEAEVTNLGSDDFLTQVGYQDAHSEKSVQQLVKKLGGESTTPEITPRPTAPVTRTRRKQPTGNDAKRRRK